MLHTKLGIYLNEFYRRCHAEGFDIKIIEMERTIEMQAKRFLQKRSKNMQSYHLPYKLSAQLKEGLEKSLPFYIDTPFDIVWKYMENKYRINIFILPQIDCRAFDAYPMIEGKVPELETIAPETWQKLGDVWKGIDPACKWGGDYETFKDYCHFYIEV